MGSPDLRIALFTYSTNPRGGVVHSIQLAEALQTRGHAVELFALGRGSGDAFFRPVTVPTTIIPFQKREDESFSQRVKRYIRRFYQGLLERDLSRFDIHHSEDCISANALWRLRDQGRIPSFLRTIHHVDDFETPSLVQCQDDSILRPDHRITVSRYWKRRLKERFGVESSVIPNGVDLDRFKPAGDDDLDRLRRELDLAGRRVLLSVGGVEPRKNTLRSLEAFRLIHEELATGPPPCWVIAGGKTLFDYRDYRDRFFRRLESGPLRQGEEVRILGTVPDQRLLRLYQSSDLLLFASVREGFGLVALEAMACRLPVVASDIDVFQEFLEDGENARLVDPNDPESIAQGTMNVLEDESLRNRLMVNGVQTARQFSWEESARRHAELYRSILH